MQAMWQPVSFFFIQQIYVFKTSLLVCGTLTQDLHTYVVYANAHSSMPATYVVACIIFDYWKIFVFLFKTCLLAIVSTFGVGVVKRILWLSFAQQED
jgi:hypothetical protein